MSDIWQNIDIFGSVGETRQWRVPILASDKLACWGEGSRRVMKIKGDCKWVAGGCIASGHFH